MSKSWSSFEKDKLLMEAWRRHINEESEIDEGIFDRMSQTAKGAVKGGKEAWAASAPQEMEEYPATEVATLYRTIDDINNKLPPNEKQDRDALHNELLQFIQGQGFVIQEQAGPLVLGKDLNYDKLGEFPTLVKFMGAAAKAGHFNILKNAFTTAGFTGEPAAATPGTGAHVLPPAAPPPPAGPTTPTAPAGEAPASGGEAAAGEEEVAAAAEEEGAAPHPWILPPMFLTKNVSALTPLRNKYKSENPEGNFEKDLAEFVNILGSLKQRGKLPPGFAPQVPLKEIGASGSVVYGLVKKMIPDNEENARVVTRLLNQAITQKNSATSRIWKAIPKIDDPSLGRLWGGVLKKGKKVATPGAGVEGPDPETETDPVARAAVEKKRQLKTAEEYDTPTYIPGGASGGPRAVSPLAPPPQSRSRRRRRGNKSMHESEMHRWKQLAGIIKG